MTRTTKAGLISAASLAGAWVATRAARATRAVDFKDKVVVITGGSRGLGLVLAREFAREGARVALVARHGDELDRAHEDIRAIGGDVAVFEADVGDRGAAEQAVGRVIERFGRVDVLANVAGVIQVGPYQHMRMQDFEEAMRVHFWGPLYMILAVLPFMTRSAPKAAGGRREPEGGSLRRIVNVSSIGGKVAVPHLLPYCASKFALTALSDGLRAELARENISVTTVCPGLMRTGSPLNAWFKGHHRGEFTWFALMDALPVLSIDAGRAARQIVEACRHGDPELLITPWARLAVIGNALVPSVFARAMSVFNRLLPGATGDADGDQAKSGWQSPSRWAPSLLTRLSDRATARNNELPQSA